MRIKIKKIQSEKEYLACVEKMLEYDLQYYHKAKPTISDYEYDLLYKELERFEDEHPESILANSPTQRVDESFSKEFKKQEHETPMLSLSNTYSEEEVKAFIQRVYKHLGKEKIDYSVELKMDGAAISVRYEKGLLVRALSRGNGKVGDIITENIKVIQGIPHKLKGKNVPDILEVRGEIFMPISIFQNLNSQREEEGLTSWANPRNAAAGSLKLLDPKEAKTRQLGALFYGISHGEKYVKSQYDIHLALKDWGLPVCQEKHFYRCHSCSEIFSFAQKILTQRANLAFEIDGIVIKVDRLDWQKKLGRTGKSPRFATAYKFAPEQAFTKIHDITIQVGRTGVLTPVAELEPVLLAGSTISRATLHNQEEIHRKDIRIGDFVIIEKGGDVIPKIVKVDFEKRASSSKAWSMPKKCPVCKTDVVHNEGEVAIRCPNRTCPAQNLRQIIFFASKSAMDIEHLGSRIVEILIQKGLIKRISDIYQLEEKDLLELEGFQEKSVQNLLHSIETSKKRPLSHFLMGLGIKHVGAMAADVLADTAGSLQNLIEMSKEELLEIDGIGETMADSIIQFFQDQKNLHEIELLLEYGVKPQQKKKKNHSFSSKIFVLTGSLEKYSREEASDLIKERGGKISSSVSTKTNYLLAGENPGSKYEKAKKLSVPIIEEEEFEKML